MHWFPFADLFPSPQASSGITAVSSVPQILLWRQKMHLGWETQPAWKHRVCGYCRFDTTELSDAFSLLFQLLSERLEPRSLRTGSNVQPDCLKEGCSSAGLLHLHRLTAASMHRATTIGGST